MPLSSSRNVSTRGLAAKQELIGRPTAFVYLWRVHVQSCMRRGYLSSITPDQFQSLISGNCHYCGSSPENFTKLRSGVRNISYNGVDRVDQSKPYELGNLVSCCKTCNSMKSKLSVQTFLEQTSKIFRHNRTE
jgi:hypothetical protein